MKYPISTAGLAAGLATVLAVACAAPQDAQPSQSASAVNEASGAVTVLTHDSFYLPEELIASFEASSGLDIEFLPVGDAGTLTNQVALTAGSPLGDAVYGIDNAFASRAVGSGALAPFAPDNEVESLDGLLTAIDFSDVCINVDITRYPQGGPQDLADLTSPEYSGMLSVPNPTTSSPGLAFLLASYVEFGPQWEDFWRSLRDNNVKVTSSWSDSYFVDFSVPNYGGDRPFVVSYASSPPSEVIDGEPTSRALLDSCFRQVEYAGVLEGAQNPAGAQAVVEWLLSEEVQSALPESMYVYPIKNSVAIPQEWLDFAPLAAEPLTMTPENIDQVREDLLRRWEQIVLEGN